MSEDLKFFLNDLENGKTKKFCGSFAPYFLELRETELSFPHAVELDVKAYLADRDLVIHVNAETEAEMPCRICNQSARVPIRVRDHYHTQPKVEISSGIVDVGSILRQVILLEVPQFAECGGDCPERELLKPYSREKAEGKEESYRPFANLTLD